MVHAAGTLYSRLQRQFGGPEQLGCHQVRLETRAEPCAPLQRPWTNSVLPRGYPSRARGGRRAQARVQGARPHPVRCASCHLHRTGRSWRQDVSKCTGIGVVTRVASTVTWDWDLVDDLHHRHGCRAYCAAHPHNSIIQYQARIGVRRHKGVTCTAFTGPARVFRLITLHRVRLQGSHLGQCWVDCAPVSLAISSANFSANPTIVLPPWNWLRSQSRSHLSLKTLIHTCHEVVTTWSAICTQVLQAASGDVLLIYTRGPWRQTRILGLRPALHSYPRTCRAKSV